MLSSSELVCSDNEVGLAGATSRGSVSTMISKSTSFSENEDMSLLLSVVASAACTDAAWLSVSVSSSQHSWTFYRRGSALAAIAIHATLQKLNPARGVVGRKQQAVLPLRCSSTRDATHEKQKLYSPILLAVKM